MSVGHATRETRTALGALWALTLLSAALVAAVPGLAVRVRGGLGLELDARRGDLGICLVSWATNLRAVR